jgi:hypothetical protein
MDPVGDRARGEANDSDGTAAVRPSESQIGGMMAKRRKDGGAGGAQVGGPPESDSGGSGPPAASASVRGAAVPCVPHASGYAGDGLARLRSLVELLWTWSFPVPLK